MKKYSYYGWLVWSLGALFYCYEYFLRISPNVFTGDLMSTYGLSGAALGNLVAFYYYAYTPMQLPVGILMDRFGPRMLLALASLCCAIGSFLFASTHIGAVAACGRFIVGFGSAFAFVGVLKLAAIWLRPDRFAMVTALATTLGTVGGMIGENGLTFLVREFGWQNTTFGAGFFGIILAFVIWAIVRNHKDDVDKSIHYKPIVLSKIFKDIGDALKQRQIWLAGIIGCLFYMPTSVFAELWGVPYLEQARGFSQYQAAGAISMIFLGWALGGPVVGFISDHLRLRKPPLIIGGLLAAILFGSVLLTGALPFIIVCVVFFMFGTFSTAENITFAIARESCAPEIAGSAVAINNTLVMFGGMVLQPIVGKFLDHSWTGTMVNGARVFSTTAYQHALVILPIGLALGAILSFFIRETHASFVKG
jgi:predicted MFS family arabinose efflux permease